MAGAVITDQGAKLRLAATLDPRLFLRLFRSDQPVLPTSMLGDFTPANFPDYADLEITGLWSAPVLDPIGRAQSQVVNLTWTRGTGGVSETEYGWLLYQNPEPAGVLVAGRRLTQPRVMSAAGQVIMISIVCFLLRG